MDFTTSTRWGCAIERRQAVFSLEREKAMRELFRHSDVAMLLVGLMGVTYFVSTTLAQAVEPVVADACILTARFAFHAHAHHHTAADNAYACC